MTRLPDESLALFYILTSKDNYTPLSDYVFIP